jgi:hypothetical protein
MSHRRSWTRFHSARIRRNRATKRCKRHFRHHLELAAIRSTRDALAARRRRQHTNGGRQRGIQVSLLALLTQNVLSRTIGPNILRLGAIFIVQRPLGREKFGGELQAGSWLHSRVSQHQEVMASYTREEQ